MLLPGSFMPGADDASVHTLAERALVSALKSGLNLSRFGVNLRIAINVPVNCLVKLPVGEIVREHRPSVDDWPGLMIDVTEEQIVTEIPLANDLSKKFAEHNVRLAIDDFGKGYASLTKLKELPFAEMKLDRSFVVGCGTDKLHAPICKTVIDLAHSFGALAVGIGLEKASDAMALVSMGCDLGQGFLFGQPMPEERFIALLKQRVMVRPAAPAPIAGCRAAAGASARLTFRSVRPGAAPAKREIVGVGQAAALRRLCLLHLIGNAVALGVGDGFFLGRELQTNLALHVA